MTTDPTTAEMQSQSSETTDPLPHELECESGNESPTQSPEVFATYCPEDDKLRLYTGWLARSVYERLRREGWTSTPKQGCDFVAVWTPQRRDTAIELCDVILDEDQSPEDRAADRAERFAMYRDKRTGEATGHADRYDAGPSAHGFQSQARAERAASRHDRIAGRAVDAWSKAEYWTRRTAGVISHALYKSAPGVRMGRIKTLEAELRRIQSRYTGEEWTNNGIEYVITGQGRGKWPVEKSKIEAIKAGCQDWENHLQLRIAYELQMLGDQGGRLEQYEVQAGGKLGGRLIIKANKSATTKRVISVSVLGPRVQGWTYKARNIPHTEFAEYQIDLERVAPDAYTPPTPESLAELAAFKKQRKAAQPAKAPCPLINPTDEEADRLQAIWNAHALAEREASYHRMSYSLPVTDCHPQKPLRMTQAQYSENSKGDYAAFETRGVVPGGLELPSYHREREAVLKEHGFPVCMVRRSSTNRSGTYSAARVIILTDKPRKPLPAAVWNKPAPETTAGAAQLELV